MSNDADKGALESEPGRQPRVDARLLEILVCPVTRARAHL